MSQPPPASTDENPSTSRRKARTASASLLKMIACAPVIIGFRSDPTPRAALDDEELPRPGDQEDHDRPEHVEETRGDHRCARAAAPACREGQRERGRDQADAREQ